MRAYTKRKIISTHPCVVCSWNSCGRSGCADTADGEPPPASEAAAARRAAMAEVGDDDGGDDDGEASETRSERMDRSMLERPLMFGCEGEGGRCHSDNSREPSRSAVGRLRGTVQRSTER